MRLLHVTDSHLGEQTWYRGAPSAWRRADDHFVALRAALGPALRDEVDLVVHTGDLFNRSKPPRRAIEAAAALFAEVARHVPVLLMPGNHDRHGLRLHFAGGIPGVLITDTPLRVTLAGVDLVAAPWTRDAKDWCRGVDPRGADLVLAHQAVDGACLPGFRFRPGHPAETLGRDQLDGVRFVLNGHIHPRQVVQVGATTVVYPGSTERTSFAERHETKGAALWDDTAWRFVDHATRPMCVVEQEADLDHVLPEALCSVRDPALDEAVLARGGWVAMRARPKANPQVSLFGSRST
jgi:predicted phosphodiesterase